MSWLIDNATGIYLLLLVIAAGFVVAWRFNQRVKFLGFAAMALVVLGLFWLMTRFVTTDAKQIENNVRAMAQAVEAGKMDDLFKHVSNDFAYKGMTREMLYQAARKSIEGNKVREVRITRFEVEEISHAKKLAKVRFGVTAFAAAMDQPFPFVTRAEFALEGDQWKLKTMRFFKTFVNTDEELDVLSIR
jgi:hypothetical protein